MSGNHIENYLDELIEQLDLTPPDLRRVLRETEDHLLDYARERQAEGISAEDAERAAVEHFGPAASIAGAVNHAHNRTSPVVQLAVSLATVAAIALCVIGVSGLVVALLGAWVGYEYIVDPVSEGAYTAERCDEFMAFHPEAKNCSSAAMLHHYDELRDYRYAAWIAGATGLTLLWFVRRRLRLGSLSGLFQPLTWAIATGLFGAGAAGFGLVGLTSGAFSGSDGTGEQLANAGASVAAFLFCLWAYLRTSGASARPLMSH